MIQLQAFLKRQGKGISLYNIMYQSYSPIVSVAIQMRWKLTVLCCAYDWGRGLDSFFSREGKEKRPQWIASFHDKSSLPLCIILFCWLFLPEVLILLMSVFTLRHN